MRYLAGYCVFAVILALTVAFTVKFRRRRIPILFGGTFSMLLSLLMPFGFEPAWPASLNSVLLAIFRTMQTYAMGNNYTAAIDQFGGLPAWFGWLYMVSLAALYIAAPVFTFGFVLSFFRNISVRWAWAFGRKNCVSFFSQASPRAVLLAKSILREKSARVFFCNVTEPAVVEELCSFGALSFSCDLGALGAGFFRGTASTSVFFMAEDERQNLSDSLAFLGAHKDGAKATLYIFTSRPEAEPLLNAEDNANLPCRRIDEARMLVYYDLLKTDLFPRAVEREGMQHLKVLLVGCGTYGTEMLKALLWSCVRENYRLTVTVIDRCFSQERFYRKYPGLKHCTDEYFKIDFRPNDDIGLLNIEAEPEFADIGFVFVALGNDAVNMETAIYLREAFLRMGANPAIHAVINDLDSSAPKFEIDPASCADKAETEPNDKEAEQGSLSHRLIDRKKQYYNIRPVGGAANLYTREVLINSELEDSATKMHLFWSENPDSPKEMKDFYAFDYNCRASRAQALFWLRRKADNMDMSISAANQQLEHRRWCIYMMTEGYQSTKAAIAAVPGDLQNMAKLHGDMVPWPELSGRTQAKDKAPMLVMKGEKNMFYEPKPEDTQGVQLPDELAELTELLAKNTHEVWAAARMDEGWSYGPTRSDTGKLHPCMVPYAELPEEEKEYDRSTAMEALRLVIKLGYKIIPSTEDGDKSPQR